jgi:hypothetical protein
MMRTALQKIKRVTVLKGAITKCNEKRLSLATDLGMPIPQNIDTPVGVRPSFARYSRSGAVASSHTSFAMHCPLHCIHSVSKYTGLCSFNKQGKAASVSNNARHLSPMDTPSTRATRAALSPTQLSRDITGHGGPCHGHVRVPTRGIAQHIEHAPHGGCTRYGIPPPPPKNFTGLGESA